VHDDQSGLGVRCLGIEAEELVALGFDVNRIADDDAGNDFVGPFLLACA